ncbi:hypothetical protein GW755_04370 [bacterium]|nr:hypothetical protein [bacterium]
MKFLPFFLIIFFLFTTNISPTNAQEKEVKITNGINVQARVPGFNLYVSGLFSPNSNVVLYNKNFLSGLGVFKTDLNGYFSFKIGLGYVSPVELCLSGIDRNSSDSRPFCFEVDLEKENYYIRDVYLSPTIKLSKNDQHTQIKGYSMPNISVILVADKNVVSNVSSDSEGYYISSLKEIKGDDHEVYTYAVGPSFLTKESRYVYYSSEGEIHTVSQNFLSVDSLYTSINSNFWYILLFVVLLMLILLIFIYRDKIKNILVQLKDRESSKTVYIPRR